MDDAIFFSENNPFFTPLYSTLDAMPVQRGHPAKNWIFTWNNYPENYHTLLVDAFTSDAIKASAYAWQQERGENNTPHIQGCVQVPRKVRFSQFGLPETLHWEAVKGTWQQAVDYCTKEATRDGEYITMGCVRTIPVKTISIEQFYPWQKIIYHQLVNTAPNDRTIYWIFDPIGNCGKSAFIKHMVVNQGAIFCAGSRTNDIVNLVFNAHEAGKVIKHVLWDLPRNSGGKISFNAIEMIKNGLIANMKYETGVAAFDPPHVVVFANCEPVDTEALSEDRWCIREIKNNNINEL